MDPRILEASRRHDNDSIGVGPIRWDCTAGNDYFPNPVTVFSQIVPSTLSHFYNSLPTKEGIFPWMQQIWEYHYISFYLQPLQFLHILTIALLLTGTRHTLNQLLFKKITKWVNVTNEEDADKFPDAAFRFLIFTWLWCWSVYIGMDKHLLTDLMAVVRGWSPGWPVPPSTYWLYMVQLGVYIHFMYATIYVEPIRKDFYATLLHHVLAMTLMLYSFGVRFHFSGVLVLILHNLADLWSEGAKCFFYLKTRNGKLCKITERISICFFMVFTLQWVFFRLYWFLTKLLYLPHVTLCYYSDSPFVILCSVLLWILYLLHFYWFYFIVLVVIRVVTGKEVKDTREIQKQQKIE